MKTLEANSSDGNEEVVVNEARLACNECDYIIMKTFASLLLLAARPSLGRSSTF